MRLLHPQELIKTGPLDHAAWNFSGLTGYVSKQRFNLIEKLLPRGESAHKVLEIGYGSGIFMPELAHYSKKLYGIDVHNKSNEVAEILHKHGVDVELVQGDAAHMPFESDFFNVVVSISALEFVADLPGAVAEIARVLKDDGIFVLVVPRQSKFLDALLWLTTGESAKKDFGDSRERVVPELMKHFVIGAQTSFWPVYRAFRLTKYPLT